MNQTIPTIEPCEPIISLSQLQPGVFWCATGGLGISAEEMEAYKAGSLPAQRRAEIECRIQMAMNYLRDVAVPGAQFWMSLQRMMS